MPSEADEPLCAVLAGSGKNPAGLSGTAQMAADGGLAVDGVKVLTE